MTDHTNASLIAASETWTPAEVHASPVGAARIIESLADALEDAEQRAEEAWKAAEDHVLDADAVHVRLSAELREVRRERDNWKLSAEEAEKAEKRWKDRAVEAERELQVAEDQANNLAGDLAQAEKERDALAAVVEKVRAADSASSSWDHFGHLVMDILATAPDDALREHDARVWDKGFEAGWAEKEDPGAFVNDVWDAKTPNPYREEER